jgi:hypothetical protein
MVSTYWAELPARLIRHADATGRLVRSPGRLPLPTETASAFLQTSAVHFGLAATRPAGRSTPWLTSCA